MNVFMAKTDWKKGDKITSALLNQTGSPIQVSNNTLKEGDATELPSGQLIVDKNGGLYISSSGKLTLVAVLKGAAGAAGKDGAQGPKGDTGATGKDGATGPKGATGAQGPAGKDGTAGAKGETGTAGAKGADGKSLKAAVINLDKNGAVTGGTITMSDDSKVEMTVNKATE